MTQPPIVFFAAAKKLVEEVGVYCLDTARVMQFTEKEIEVAVRNAPGRVKAGQGIDRKYFGMRMPDEHKWPWFQVGSGIVSSKSAYASNIVEGYASIPEVCSIQIPSLSSIRGIPISAGAPTEFYAGVLGMKTALDALQRAGRPGLPIFNLQPTTAVAVTNIAASAPQFGSRLTDAWLCGSIAEMKINYDTLNKVAYLHASGANVAAESGPMLGGFSGGAGRVCHPVYGLPDHGTTGSQGTPSAQFPHPFHACLLEYPGRDLGCFHCHPGVKPEHKSAGALGTPTAVPDRTRKCICMRPLPFTWPG